MGKNSGYNYGISICQSIKSDGSGEPLYELVGTEDLSSGHDWSADNETFKLDEVNITLTNNCADLDEVVTHIRNTIDGSSLDYDDYYVYAKGNNVAIGYCQFKLSSSTGALTTIGWSAGIYKYNIIYMAAKQFDHKSKFKPRITTFKDGLSYDLNLGEREIECILRNIIFYEYNNNSSTDMYNKFADLAFASSQSGADHLYLHVKDLEDNKYVILSFINSTDTNIPLLKGRIKDFTGVFREGKKKLSVLKFKESWMSLSL